MKYWAYLTGKLVVGGLIAWGIGRAVYLLFPTPDQFAYVTLPPFAHDLTYTFLMLLYMLFCAGLLWAIVWDQRYRCRSCGRRLRMPIVKGSWTHVLLGPPRTEYICPYGHGTLKVPELHITGQEPLDWQPHEDMWKELHSLEEPGK